MKKQVIYVLLIGFAVTFLYSLFYTYRVYKSNEQLSFESQLNASEGYRIVLISQELHTPFWNDVMSGANEIAKKNHMTVASWGTVRSNQEELIKYMEIAIASKVDGMIVQGIDTPEVNEEINKALIKGIPVITVATDVSNSLRKSYVGSNHYSEGKELARQIVSSLGEKGLVGFISDDKSLDYQTQREKGLREVLDKYPNIHIVKANPQTGQVETVKEKTNHLLNQYPTIRTFVDLSAQSGADIVQVIRSRSNIYEYAVFSFDSNPNILSMVRSGYIKATIAHQPIQMGKKSVLLILQWLEGKDIPLKQHYYTPFTVVTGKSAL